MIARPAAGGPAAPVAILTAPMADARNESPDAQAPVGDPARPRYLGLWVAGILLVVLFGGAGGVIADVFFRLATGR